MRERRAGMKALLVYDSVFGNTERIAKAIGEATGGKLRIARVNGVGIDELKGLDLLIVASPTVGGRPTEAVQDFLNRIPPAGLRNVRVAAFDTRLAMRFVKLFGYAAEKICIELVARGGIRIASPQGFFVNGRKGPLAETESDRAADWAKKIIV
jgi:flavodoxin I